MPAPQAQQERRTRLEAEEAANAGKTPEQIAEEQRAAANDNTNTNTNTGDDGRVTISRAEFNDLQAAADRVKAAERKAEGVQGDLLALQSRLTELEALAKGSSTAAPAARPEASTAPADPPITPLTEKEKAEFEEDTITLMEKIANNVFTSRIAAYRSFVEDKVGSVEMIANTAATSAQRVSTDGYTAQVRSKVAEFSDFDKITQHQHWPAFVQAEDDLSGRTYAELIQDNLDRKRVDPMVRIFKKFYEKYLKDEVNTDGYAGGAPSGTTHVDTNAGGKPAGAKMLKYSDRQKAQQDYLAQPRRITYDEYEAVKKEFELADREGRVDYTA